ncbi:25S rRNA (adenine2142-N1)-methyltransferase [Sporobolomyces salmoneus]|uniref:25S rRNA (adenine2142-N1)-methyltransferase n=1 Tax=Sporobolomyces salmoneus TaxID=183962 RepID=UPI00317E7171
MPHTNNAYAVDRKASRSKNKPAFLSKKKKSATSTGDSTSREDQTELIRQFHALEKQLKAPQTTEEEKVEIRRRQEELGGLETYQKASLHGADKLRGGETSKWLIKQLKQYKVGLDTTEAKGKEKVEPTILEDGTKVWPKPKERRKLKLLDVGAIAGTAYASESWIDTTSIDLNPQAPHVIKSNFFEFPSPDQEEELFDVVSLSLVMNFEGSLINRGHFLLHAHSYLKRASPGYLYIVLPLPCLTNSRYLTHQHFRSILASTNWEVVGQHDSAKLSYWFLRETDKTEGAGRRGDGKVWKREELRKGVAPRNNFCIVVKPEEPVEKGVEEEQEKEVTGEEESQDSRPADEKVSKSSRKKKGGNQAVDVKEVKQNGPAGGNKKRKAEDEEGGPTREGDAEKGSDGDGEDQQKKKKAKKSKPIKGKKIVFDE